MNIKVPEKIEVIEISFAQKESFSAAVNANHTNQLGLKISLECLKSYCPTSLIIFHDLIKHSGGGWLNSKRSDIGYLISETQALLLQNCSLIAEKLLDDVSQITWKISRDGVFCIGAKKTMRFTIKTGHKDNVVCNPLELGLVVSILALEKSLNNRSNDMRRALNFYKDFLGQILVDQAEDSKAVINASKVCFLIQNTPTLQVVNN